MMAGEAEMLLKFADVFKSTAGLSTLTVGDSDLPAGASSSLGGTVIRMKRESVSVHSS